LIVITVSVNTKKISFEKLDLK